MPKDDFELDKNVFERSEKEVDKVKSEIGIKLVELKLLVSKLEQHDPDCAKGINESIRIIENQVNVFSFSHNDYDVIGNALNNIVFYTISESETQAVEDIKTNINDILYQITEIYQEK